MSEQRTTFAQAVLGQAEQAPAAAPTPPRPPSAPTALIDTSVGVVETTSGEVLDFATIDHDYLIEILMELRRRERQIRDLRQDAEEEAIVRHGDRKAPMVVGAWEVDIDRRWARVWDPDDLQGVIDDLVDRGVLEAKAALGVLKVEVKVDGNEARRLVSRLDGEALSAVNDCFVWKQGRSTVTVTAVPDLARALPKAHP